MRLFLQPEMFGETAHMKAGGGAASPQSLSALMLLTKHNADQGDKEGTQSKANLDYLEQM